MAEGRVADWETACSVSGVAHPNVAKYATLGWGTRTEETLRSLDYARDDSG